ncbi:hypothetical protein NLJ89_g8335 [Agrocybe chaxingu]|uniref:MYND-type domain-containing protein n=1 Tax=Agrocybe chaxingu TaxID=84603 RepID=A0A9W8MS90_9AGAR|nr:hypothetical protein NLJ89_g8335 [Agrocybe chaxingu]
MLKTCQNCFKEEEEGGSAPRLKSCRGCKIAHYCNPQCQTEHWKYHKPICTLSRISATQARKDYRLLHLGYSGKDIDATMKEWVRNNRFQLQDIALSKLGLVLESQVLQTTEDVCCVVLDADFNRNAAKFDIRCEFCVHIHRAKTLVQFKEGPSLAETIDTVLADRPAFRRKGEELLLTLVLLPELGLVRAIERTQKDVAMQTMRHGSPRGEEVDGANDAAVWVLGREPLPSSTVNVNGDVPFFVAHGLRASGLANAESLGFKLLPASAPSSAPACISRAHLGAVPILVPLCTLFIPGTKHFTMMVELCQGSTTVVLMPLPLALAAESTQQDCSVPGSESGEETPPADVSASQQAIPPSPYSRPRPRHISKKRHPFYYYLSRGTICVEVPPAHGGVRILRKALFHHMNIETNDHQFWWRESDEKPEWVPLQYGDQRSFGKATYFFTWTTNGNPSWVTLESLKRGLRGKRRQTADVDKLGGDMDIDEDDCGSNVGTDGS